MIDVIAHSGISITKMYSSATEKFLEELCLSLLRKSSEKVWN